MNGYQYPPSDNNRYPEELKLCCRCERLGRFSLTGLNYEANVLTGDVYKFVNKEKLNDYPFQICAKCLVSVFYQLDKQNLAIGYEFLKQQGIMYGWGQNVSIVIADVTLPKCEVVLRTIKVNETK